MSYITIAVVLMGAAVTIGLAIWHSQKGKTQGPAIIDNQRVSQEQVNRDSQRHIDDA
jgi:hypothetical protein